MVRFARILDAVSGILTQMPLPNFIVIGPGRSGTTWMYQCLKEHPEVCLAKETKETVFFQDYYDRGVDWYAKFFDHCSEAKAIGEVSNSYFFSKEVPHRIKKVIPNAKLITCIRNPLDRLYSWYLFRLRNGLVTEPFEVVIEKDPAIVSKNFLYDNLQEYLQVFGRENIFIGLFDDIEERPEQFITEIYSFLEIDADFQPSVIRKKILGGSEPRSKFIFHQLKKIALWARENDLHWLLSWGKFNPVVTKVLLKPYSPDSYPKMAKETREHLREIFGDQIEKLSELLGRDLNHWE